MQVLKRNWV